MSPGVLAKKVRGRWLYRCENPPCAHLRPMNAGSFVNHGRGPEHRMHFVDIHEAMEDARTKCAGTTETDT